MADRVIIKTAKFPKPEHKFFDRYLDANLEDLAAFLQKTYASIEDGSHPSISKIQHSEDRWTDSGSITTVMWRDYNAFQLHHPAIFNLLKAVSEMTREACEYYGEDFEANQFMVQGWFNINYNHTGKLDWHEHSETGSPIFHGYYCIKAEPSETHYKIKGGGEKINVNKDNRAVLSETSHPHAMGDWDWDGPRITLAYDVTPMRMLPPDQEQHWIPLYA